MSEKHTPGPWYQDRTTVYGLNARNMNRFYADVKDAHTPQHELEANARLMAVAPDLFAHASALIEFVKQKYGVSESELTCEHMRGLAEAIAKARGAS